METFKVTLELTNKDGSDVYIHSSGNVDGNEYDSYDKSGVDLSVNQSAVTYAKKYKNKVEYDNNGIMKSFILKEK